MVELAASGLTPDQTALMLELMASVTMDARPTADAQAERRRAADRERKRDAAVLRNSAETAEGVSPNDIYSNPHPQSSSKASPSQKTRRGSRQVDKPEDVSEPVWQDTLRLRREKRAPITETVLIGFRTEGEKLGWTLEQVLIECCQRGWQGFKAKWITENGHGRAQQPTRDRLADAYRQACIDADAEREAEASGAGTGPTLPPDGSWSG